MGTDSRNSLKEIVVLSGKGGTGKTSIAASLAMLAGTSAIIADCDVDAANMHLLLQPDFAERSEFFSGLLAEIDQSACTQCDICAKTCRFNAIPFANGQYTVNPLACEGCGFCHKVCPTGAIRMEDRLAGNLFVSTIKTGGTMVHARLGIGAENSGKLVAKVKSEARQIAQNQGIPLVIADGSPGIGCPVISSLSGANYVILVTEPSVSGLHDLKRVSAVVKKFRIKAGCIINKADINPQKAKEIEEFLHMEGISHLANIPFNINFTRAMAQAQTIVEYDKPLALQMETLWAKIREELSKGGSLKPLDNQNV